MAGFTFSYGPVLHVGAGAVDRVGGLAADGPLLLVTDAAVRALGLVDAALAALHDRKVVIFDAVEADPARATVEAAVRAGARAAGVVGIGGGSPLDVAKLAAYLIGSGEPLDAIWGVGQTRGRGLPLVLVPTTAGTGSEATPVAIVTLPGGEKRAVSSAALVAGHAVLDPLLTIGLPREITAATGMDAIVHAVEAFTSARAKNPLSDLLAREALRLLAANLRTACDSPADLAARTAMLLGAHYAGVAFANAPVGGVHALAYPLGGRFKLPHGVSNVLMLPHVLRHNAPAATALYAELAALLGPGDGDLAASLAALAAGAGMPQRLRDIGIARADLPRLAADAMLQTRLLANNPHPIGEGDALRIYEAAW